jgi:hypothetical protein
MGLILILTDTMNRHLGIECSGCGSLRWLVILGGVRTRHQQLNEVRWRLLQTGPCMECLGTGIGSRRTSAQGTMSLTKYLTMVLQWLESNSPDCYWGKIPCRILSFDDVSILSLAGCGMYDRSYIA